MKVTDECSNTDVCRDITIVHTITDSFSETAELLKLLPTVQYSQ